MFAWRKQEAGVPLNSLSPMGGQFDPRIPVGECYFYLSNRGCHHDNDDIIKQIIS